MKMISCGYRILVRPRENRKYIILRNVRQVEDGRNETFYQYNLVSENVRRKSVYGFTRPSNERANDFGQLEQRHTGKAGHTVEIQLALVCVY